MNPEVEISKQQYRTYNNIFVFMALSQAEDQAVFPYINILAKAYKGGFNDFYDLVRNIRSKMTRIKFAAEHDMGTSIVCVGRTATNRPKFRMRPAETTHASVLDKLPDGKSEIEQKIGSERLANRLGGRTFKDDFQDVDIPKGKKSLQGVTAPRKALLHEGLTRMSAILVSSDLIIALDGRCHFSLKMFQNCNVTYANRR
jgi:hypothetical protein